MTKRQITQWPNDKVQKDKQRSTKHYTENKRARKYSIGNIGISRPERDHN